MAGVRALQFSANWNDGLAAKLACANSVVVVVNGWALARGVLILAFLERVELVVSTSCVETGHIGCGELGFFHILSSNVSAVICDVESVHRASLMLAL